jgi:ureidoglycolate dehydrogenase (NAD+)
MVVHFPERRLHDFVRATLAAAGLTDAEADACADAAVFADLRGTATHGVLYIVPRTLESIREGKTASGATAIVARDRGAVALIRGNGLVGPALGRQAMTLAIAKAREYGVGAVATRNGNPLGMLGYYSALALPEGLIGLAMANTAPAVAPHGSSGKVFGTNPISFAVPAGREPAILFDAATSVAAAGKLIQARRRGEALPAGWVIDATGAPITDPRRAGEGSLLPFGGHKGSAVAGLVHLLTGGLAGATVGGEETHDHPDPDRRGQSSFFLALNPDFFSSRAIFSDLVDRHIQAIHAAPPLPGVAAVLAPGERGWREAERARREGVTLTNEDWSALLSAMREAGLPADEIVALHGP